MSLPELLNPIQDYTSLCSASRKDVWYAVIEPFENV